MSYVYTYRYYYVKKYFVLNEFFVPTCLTLLGRGIGQGDQNGVSLCDAAWIAREILIEDSGFSLDLMVKDLTTAVDLARETSTPAVFSAACRELWAAALSRSENEADHTAVVRWFEEMADSQLGEA